MFGIYLRHHLPEEHLDEQSKDVVKMGIGLMASTAALFLSLQLNSAKDFYDSVNNELTEVSAKLIVLDRALARYGPEAEPARELLHNQVERVVTTAWSMGRGTRSQQGDPSLFYARIEHLSPRTEEQGLSKTRALSIAYELGDKRWLLFQQETRYVSMPLVAVLVGWLTIIFISFGLFAPRNTTVLCVLFICAVCITGAVFLLLELHTPFTGVVKLSNQPLRNALALMGQ